MKTPFFLAALVVVAFAEEETPALKELKSGNLLFSAKTYKELAASNTGNFLVCPLSVSVVLALAEAGAGGKTATQLIAGLDLPDSDEKIQAAMKAIAPSLNVEVPYTLSSANAIYVKEGYKLRPAFTKVAIDVFNAQVQSIDFTKSDAAAKINDWVLKNTHDKIKDLISKDDLDADTRAVLINALYFHALWSKPFYVEGTTDKPFHVSSTKEVTVKMMEQTDSFSYYECDILKAKFLEMDYYRSPISMTIVLPNDKDGLAALEANIDKVLETPKYTHEKVHVQIPHVNVEAEIDFVKILKKFGVIDAFERNANFSGIIQSDETLKISKIIQKTFIAVEEKGTTAAAATAVLIPRVQSISINPKPPKEFEANHPFIFILKSENGILFVGRYVDGPN